MFKIQQCPTQHHARILKYRFIKLLIFYIFWMNSHAVSSTLKIRALKYLPKSIKHSLNIVGLRWANNVRPFEKALYPTKCSNIRNNFWRWSFCDISTTGKLKSSLTMVGIESATFVLLWWKNYFIHKVTNIWGDNQSSLQLRISVNFFKISDDCEILCNISRVSEIRVCGPTFH